MKMKYNDSKVWGQKLLIAIDGEVEVSKKGEVEVSKEAFGVLKGSKGWQVLSDSEDNEDDLDDNDGSDNEDNSENNDEDNGEPDPTMKDLLKQTVPELKGICTEMEFPEDEWKSLKKVDLAKYIIEQTQ